MVQTAEIEQVSIKLDVAEDGTLAVPAELVRQLDLSPGQTVTATIRQDELVLKRELSRQEKADRIRELLRFALKGVEWSEIEEGRRDRY